MAALAVLRQHGHDRRPGPGGVLIATTGAGRPTVIDAASLPASPSSSRATRRPPDDDAEAPPGTSVEGLRYARSRQELIGTYVVDFVAMVFGMPLALFPALAADRPAAGPGPLYAAPAAVRHRQPTSRWVPRVHRHGLAVMVAATVSGVAIVGFGFSASLWPALACLAIAGGADAISGIFRMTMWNQTIPDALRGRLAGIEMVGYMSGPLLGHVELAPWRRSPESRRRSCPADPLRRRRHRLRPRPAPLSALRCPHARPAARLNRHVLRQGGLPMFRPVIVAALLALTVLAPASAVAQTPVTDEAAVRALVEAYSAARDKATPRRSRRCSPPTPISSSRPGNGGAGAKRS